jgi:hypothetical protein
MPGKLRWYTNQAGTRSTLVRPGIALSPAEYQWREKNATQRKTTVNQVLYHLTKEAINLAMQREGEWCE